MLLHLVLFVPHKQLLAPSVQVGRHSLEAKLHNLDASHAVLAVPQRQFESPFTQTGRHRPTEAEKSTQYLVSAQYSLLPPQKQLFVLDALQLDLHTPTTNGSTQKVSAAHSTLSVPQKHRDPFEVQDGKQLPVVAA